MRQIVPLLVLFAAGALMFWSFASRSNDDTKTNDPAGNDPTLVAQDDSPSDGLPDSEPVTPTGNEDGNTALADIPPPDDAATPDPADTTAPDPTPTAAAPAQAARPLAIPAAAAALGLELTDDDATLGDADGYNLTLTTSRFGAGIRSVALREYRQQVNPDSPRYTLIDNTPPLGQPGFSYYPFGARALTVNGRNVTGLGDENDVDEFGERRAYNIDAGWWGRGPIETTDDGQAVTYHLLIVDADDQPLLHIQRRYVVTRGSYDILLEQTLTNRSGRPLPVQLSQYFQSDVLADDTKYMGDRRRVVTGYFRPDVDPGQARVYTEDGFYQRNSILKGKDTIWPRRRATDRLAWVALENRYFSVTTHAVVPPDTQATTAVTPLTDAFPTINATGFPNNPEFNADARVLLVSGTTDVLTLAPNEIRDVSVAFYAGPLKKELLNEHPYDLLQLKQLIKYELGCTLCTFQWLARGLLSFLSFIHGLVGDWGVAIIILVLCVRALLHPITKRSQINMMVFGKQMQRIQPELEKLKAKYADDPQKFQSEQMKLWREHHINPLRMLGCLPMFLQTPIWIALYAMIFYAVELRHEPAFYGVFQSINGWSFLADLSRPDRFISFTSEQKIFSMGFFAFDYSALNILPLIWIAINIINMTLNTPAAATDQAKAQQRMMKVMMSLFGVFLYAAPSALTLYMCASTSVGIIDAMIVRRHVKHLEDSGKLDPEHPESIFKKKDKKPAKPPKPGSLKWKMQRRLELAKEAMEAQQKAAAKGQGGGGSPGGNRAVRRANQRRKK